MHPQTMTELIFPFAPNIFIEEIERHLSNDAEDCNKIKDTLVVKTAGFYLVLEFLSHAGP